MASASDLFRASFDSSTNLMAVTRVSDGRLYDVNRAWQETLGYTREEVLGKTAIELGIWHAPEERAAMIDTLKKDGVARNFRVTLQTKGGELLECLMTMNMLDSSNQEYLLFSAYDVSTLKSLQKELRQSHDELEQRIEERTRELSTEIEEREKITSHLRERDAQYAHAERIARTHNWITDAEFDEWIACSKNTEHVLKTPINQLLSPNSKFLSYIHQDDISRVRETFADVRRNPHPYAIEYRFCPPGGELLYLRDGGEPVYDDAGTLVSFRGTTQDITELRKQEEELHRQGVMSQQAAKIAGLGHWVWDEIEDRCIYCTEEVPGLYGVTMEEFMGLGTRTFDELERIHPDDRIQVMDTFERCVANGDDYQQEYRLLHPDGTIRWIQDTGMIYERENGRVKSTLGTIRDITRRKIAQQALEESELRNRAIVETAADGIITIDENCIIGTFNQAAERIFGFRQCEVIGKNVEFLMPEPYASLHDGYVSAYLRTGIAKVINIGREVEGLRKDGSTFPMLLAVSDVQTTGKRIFTGIVRDISDFKEVEQRALIAKEEAERANEAKTDFLAHMSHEFRTPLNAIIGFSQTMSNEIFGSLGHPKYVDYIDGIQSSGHLLLDIVNDILDISKVEAGEMKLSETVFSPSQVIQECITAMNGPSTNDARSHMEFSDGTSTLRLLADGRLFKQILLNLLSNAVKFTPADGMIKLVSEQDDDGGLIVRIIDTGCGIHEEDLALIMEPFGQARSGAHTAHKGTGLGLSLSKILTELHDATLSMESEVDKGTTVILRFPAHRSVETT